MDLLNSAHVFRIDVSDQAPLDDFCRDIDRDTPGSVAAFKPQTLEIEVDEEGTQILTLHAFRLRANGEPYRNLERLLLRRNDSLPAFAQRAFYAVERWYSTPPNPLQH